MGVKIEEQSSMQMFDALSRREDYEELIKEGQRIDVRCLAFIKYYFVYLFIVLLWIVWLALIIVWSMHGVEEWNFDKAQYFAFSLCSSAGSLSLPHDSPEYLYLLAGISMLIGVPLMAMAISAIVVMIWQGHNYRKIKRAAWDAVLTEELRLLEQLDVGAVEEGGQRITKSGYILLGLLRMGQDGGIIKYLANAYDEHDQRGGVLVDFGGETTTHVCMYLTGTPPCQSSFGDDYQCELRCWGYGSTMSGENSTAEYVTKMEGELDDSSTWPNHRLGSSVHGVNSTPWELPLPTMAWNYPKYFGSDELPINPNTNVGEKNSFNPQGFVFTMAGSLDGDEGFVDGLSSTARYVDVYTLQLSF